MINFDNQTSSKRIAKNTMMLYIRMFIMLFIGLYASRVIINVLGIQDYGLYEVIGGIVAMFGFVNSSMATATSRFLTYELGKKDFDINKLRKIFHVSLTIHIFIAILILILGETIGLWFVCNKIQMAPGKLIAGIFVYQSVLFSLIITIINVPYNASIISHERMDAYAYIGIIDATLKVLILFLLPILPFDKLISYSICYLLIQCALQCLYIVYCRRKFDETSFRLDFDKEIMKGILPFLGWNLAKEFGGVCSNQGLNVLLNLFFGPSVNAARGIMFQVQQAVAKCCINFQVAVNPQIIKSYASDDLNYMQKLAYTSSKFAFFLLFILALPIWFEIDSILTWWIKTVPDYTAIFIRIMLFEAIFSVMSNPLTVSVIATGRIKYFQIVMTITSLLILPISYLFLSFGGKAEVVFVINVVFSFISYIIKIYFVNSILHFSLRNDVFQVLLRILWPFMLCVLFTSLVYINFQTLPYRTIVVFVTSFSVSLIAIYCFGMTSSERGFINRLIKKYAWWS